MTLEHEKATRIKYQNIVYEVCNLLDTQKYPCPDCDIEDVVPRVRTLLLKTRTTGVLQPWVVTLGLRHQGVLMACVRGCDSVPKEDPTKTLARCLRGTFLQSFDPKPSSFIEHVDDMTLRDRMVTVLSNHDHYPIHYLMHMMHGSEIVGYKWPDGGRVFWRWFYEKLAQCFHLNIETEEQMDARLGACEASFAKQAKDLDFHVS